MLQQAAKNIEIGGGLLNPDVNPYDEESVNAVSAIGTGSALGGDPLLQNARMSRADRDLRQGNRWTRGERGADTGDDPLQTGAKSPRRSRTTPCVSQKASTPSSPPSQTCSWWP